MIRHSIANGLWLAANRGRHRRYRAALRNPRAAQEVILRRYLRRHADTQFGREHDFVRLDSVRAFQEHVPLSTYDSYGQYIQRIRAGESGVLTAERVRRLLPSSGSAGAGKLIPYTRGLQAEFGRAIGPWIVDLYTRRPSLLRGRAYWAVSPAMTVEDDASVVPIGFDHDSAYLGGLFQRIVNSTLAVPEQVRDISHVETFRYVTVLSLLRAADLRLISVWHPSFLSLLLGAMVQWWDRLLADVERGATSPPEPLPRPLQRTLARRVRADRRRAEYLNRQSPTAVTAVWPHLAVISCWADGHAVTAAAQLATQVGDVPIEPKSLVATEAFVTIPYRNATPLAVRSHFFEFLDDRDQPWLADELDVGRTYSVVATTAGGLCRYRLHDQVQVDGMVDATPSLRFVGKTDSISDYCGEKLSDAFVADVLGRVLQTVAPTGFAMLAPNSHDGRPGYALYLQADRVPPGLADRVDRELGANPHYAYCRSLGQLAPLRVFHVANGAHETYIERCRQLGQPLGDIKPRALDLRADWHCHFPGNFVDCAQ